LEQAVERFEKRFIANPKTLSPSPIENSDNKIAIPIGQSIRFIDLDEVVYLKAENTYTEIHLQDNTKLLVSRTLKNFEEVLANKTSFYRCHKSYIINKNYVLDYVKSDGGYLILKPKTEIPISTDKVEEFLQQATIVKRS
jgi:two-component system LytT family response regulator